MKEHKFRGSTVTVKDGNVEKALRKFKKKIQESGKLDEVKERMEYVKPSVTRVANENKARRRWQRQVEADEIAGRRLPRDGQRRRLY